MVIIPVKSSKRNYGLIADRINRYSAYLGECLAVAEAASTCCRLASRINPLMRRAVTPRRCRPECHFSFGIKRKLILMGNRRPHFVLLTIHFAPISKAETIENILTSLYRFVRLVELCLIMKNFDNLRPITTLNFSIYPF